MFLLKDGVKYNLWKPQKENEVEGIVIEHSREIFGEDTIYFHNKKVIKSKAKILSIPDAYLIYLSKPYAWSVVEIELSSHPVFEHVVPQLTKFWNGIKNEVTRKQITEVLYNEIKKDVFLEARVTKKIGSGEIYRFLSNVVSTEPGLILVVEEKTDQLKEAAQSLAFQESDILEIKTFRRQDAENVHIHLFPTPRKIHPPKPPTKKTLTIAHLIQANIIRSGDKFIAKYKNKSHSATVTQDGTLEINGKEYQTPSGAGDRITGYACDGWFFWKYKDPVSGQLKPIAELRAKVTGGLRKWWIPKE